MPVRCRVQPDVRDMVIAKASGSPYDQSRFDQELKSAVAEVVRHQADCGIDCVNDGELSKTNFTDYARWRIDGYELRPSSGTRRLSITARDETKFADYFATNPRNRPTGLSTMPVCVSELRYNGHTELGRNLNNFKAALSGVSVAGAFCQPTRQNH